MIKLQFFVTQEITDAQNFIFAHRFPPKRKTFSQSQIWYFWKKIFFTKARLCNKPKFGLPRC